MRKIEIFPRTFHFIQPAGTSRGIYTERKSWLLRLTDSELEGREGIGECAPLPRLSCDDLPDYEAILQHFCTQYERTNVIPREEMLPFPSMLFGLETAEKHFLSGSFALYDTPFSRGEEGIPINGLVWMGSYEEMLSRMQQKISQGFRCIKIKIGAIDFDKELDLIRRIRERFTASDIEIRVDANGGFAPCEAMDRLNELAKYDIHSIEQPIRQHQWREMARLCAESPLPIALDEELIGVHLVEEKQLLLDTIRPQYIILKPSLHGGISGTEEWIRLARERNIGSWITSALESNVGLNAVSQLAAHVYGPNIDFPQGLGTGLLFADNIKMPIEIRGSRLWFLLKEERVLLKEERGEGREEREYQNKSVRNCSDVHTFNIERSQLSDIFSAEKILLHTSGSTGRPKEFWAETSRMRASAEATCNFLGLKEGDSALLCMSTEYIAGKMMLMRALVRNLRLISVPPSGHPLLTVVQPITFAAMVPLQVFNSLSVPVERERLKRIKHLIIGGGAIDQRLESQLRDFPNAIWSTYAMTETLSHVAMRRLNGSERSDWYTPLEGVNVSLADDGCLIIDAPKVCSEPLKTNDLAVLNPNNRQQFKIIGRKDNVVCSGGIKIQIEEVEEILHPYMKNNFMIGKRRDPKFGEIMVLLIENGDEKEAESICRNALPKYWQPRSYVSVSALPLTETGKPRRNLDDITLT